MTNKSLYAKDTKNIPKNFRFTRRWIGGGLPNDDINLRKTAERPPDLFTNAFSFARSTRKPSLKYSL